ncbi:hypothetical protein [Halomarina oriensis]|uniref:Fenitrothion hydrolase n=1 Tax=Halomarina oriensis TaxID=671145 RepID=A0A6B0GF85_9EURY|nr:hypothetical protein [Halomarina oriensis]MWG33170.1 hypothetical protein [Halomarina oriensis]
MHSRSGRRATLVVALVVLALSLASGVVAAHEVGNSRFEAPLPLAALFAGAGATVALTAAWLAVTDRTDPRRQRDLPTLTLPALPVRFLHTAAGVGFLLGVAVALWSGLTGRQVAAENVATLLTWLVWFHGLALVSLLVGSPWRVLAPWLTFYRALERLEGGALPTLDYPERLGAWPALVGFLLLFGVVENLTPGITRSPRLTAVVVAAYAGVMVAGTVAFGRSWVDHGDPLGAFYDLLGRVAPVEWECGDDDGVYRATLRPPWRACVPPVADLALGALAVAAVYTVSFDGFVETREFQTVLFTTREALGTGPATTLPLYLLGVALFCVTFALAVVLADRLGGVGGDDPSSGETALRTDGGTDWRGGVRRFAPTVLPIAAAYEVAHTYPAVVTRTATLVDLSLAPVGVTLPDPLAWLSVPAFWGSQVVLVVLGHVVAVVAAHLAAVARYETPRAARRGHLPLVVVMVGYTVLSLWIVSRPVVA